MAIRGQAGEAGTGQHPPDVDRPPQSEKRAGKRGWRIVQWAVGVSFLSVALGILALWFVAKHLDAPWIKSRIIALAKEQAGVDIDYAELDLSWPAGMHVRALRVFSPPRFAHAAETFVRVDEIAVKARLWPLLSGELQIPTLRVVGVDISVVTDESGHTTLSELFPPEPEQDSSQQTRLSQVLEQLPRLRVEELDIGALGGRSIEIDAGRPARVLTLSGVRIQGVVHSDGHGLAGTDVQVVGAPGLHLELDDGGRVRHAELMTTFDVHAADADSVSLRVRVELGSQDFFSQLPAAAQLLELDTTLHFDAAAGTTSVSPLGLRALDAALSVDATAQLFDAEAFRAVSSGKASIHLAALPIPIEGVSLRALDVDVSARELSWDGARLAGAADVSGHIAGLELARPELEARLAEGTLVGNAEFQGERGNFHLAVSAPALAADSPLATLNLGASSLDLHGQTHDEASVQQLEAEAVLTLGSARVRAPTGRRLELEALKLQARARASTPELARQSIAHLEGSLDMLTFAAGDGLRQSMSVSNLSATASVEGLARDVDSPLGVTGALKVALSLPSSRLQAGPDRLALVGAGLRAALPLSLARASAALSLASATAPAKSLRDLSLDIELEDPLSLRLDSPAAGKLSASGRIGAFRVGDSQGALESLRLVGQKLGPDGYHLELDGTGSALVAQGKPVPGRVVTSLRADLAPVAGTLALTSTIRGAAGAELELELGAGFERSSGELAYRATFAAEKLDALSALLVGSGAAAGLRPGARLTATAHGKLGGVLERGSGPLPAPTANPLRSARGTQALEVELAGLDYQATDSSVVIPKVAFQVESVHREGGAGHANARIRMPSVELSGGGQSLRLGGLDQTLVASFDQPPSDGLVDVRSTLALASVAQSLLPSFRVVDLRVSSSVQVEYLRSFFLRELVVDNPASGTRLRASGALEHSATSAPGSGNTIVGREALSIEGRLEQELAPLQAAGLASRASGSLHVPFRVESGGLLGYRLVAALQANQVSLANPDQSLVIEDLNGVIPLVEDIALLPSGPVLSAGPRASPLSETRFFDVHPFLTGDDYLTARSVRFRGETLGPLAANVRLDRTDFFIDQLQTGYRRGQIAGQVRISYREGDPIVRLRLNATGLRAGKSAEVLDANAALSFVPAALTLDGKVQIVRASRAHLYEILDVLDPFHEMMNANRVRRALALGYPKFVRFQLHDGSVDAKVELGGLAQLVRVDEIRAVPLGPILQKYVAPSFAGLLGTPARPGRASGRSVEPGSDKAAAESQALEERTQETHDVRR